MNRTESGLLAALGSAVPGGVHARASDRLRMAHDASHYLLTPRAVVTPNDTQQLACLMRVASDQGVALTFRSGGTSLSGQAVTDQILVDTRRHFRGIEILDGGERVRLQPGALLRHVNNQLAAYGRKLGPDPASESVCTIGGVIANNSSGMTCGTEYNTYRTLDSLVLLLPSGNLVDTCAPDADERLERLEPDLFTGLLKLRQRVRSNPDSLHRIEAQYAMKNTMGYGVNALVDFATPTQILAHLVVGSEGTLGFVASATLRTLPAHHYAATGLLVFATLREAMAAMPALAAAGPAAVELLDAASLRVAQRDPAATQALRRLRVLEHAALLVEWQSSNAAELERTVRRVSGLISELPLVDSAALSSEAAVRAALWHVRKGLYTAVAGARPSGTTALLEDVAVPVVALADACTDLTALFDRYAYSGSVIFGHAKDGNLHFMVVERFSSDAAPGRYAGFTEEMVDLILGYGGTLKAEHGTGRIMAPFVRRQFGDELHAVMREIKLLCDPRGILNPDVVLTEDPQLHLRDLKVVPTIEPEVDRCVECGYCEAVCPSADLTTTPRQRIVLRRELAAAHAAGDFQLVRELQNDYRYDAVETCAVDGMCAIACPVQINTGDLTRRLRTQANGAAVDAVWGMLASNWNTATRAIGFGLSVAAALPAVLPAAASRAARLALGADRMPAWQPDLPRGGVPRHPRLVDEADAVYVPSCLNTLFAPAEAGPGVMAAVLALAERAGVRLLIPRGIAGLCCGTPWSSKGLRAGHQRMRRKVQRVVQHASRGGALPVITDAASCAEGFQKELGTITVIDAVVYSANILLPRLRVRRRLESLVVHPTCSSTHIGSNEALMVLANAIADEVLLPENWRCCGFAGDRGMLHPELTASATSTEAAEVRARRFRAYASVNRPCEIGMTRATGETYHHLLELVEQCTR